jgi:hypothetical protein
MTLKDKLSRLTYARASTLLGTTGAKLIRDGGAFEIDIPTQVRLDTKRMRVSVDGVSVTLGLDPGDRHQLRFGCSRCETPCAHVGAVFSLVLEEKMALGLAAAPAEDVPFEHLSEEDLVKRALAERGERALKERMRMTLGGHTSPWTDHVVTSGASGLAAGRIILLLPGFPLKHPRNLQAHHIRTGPGEAAVPRETEGETVSPHPSQRPPRVREGCRDSPAAA